MKRLVAIALCLALGVSLVTGCSSNKKAKTETKATDASNVNAPGVFPIVKNKITLTIMVGQDASVIDYNTNGFTKWYEGKTNIHVNWNVVPQDGVAEKTQLLLAGGGDLPDIILQTKHPLSGAQLVTYGTQGVLIPLNSLIDQYAPNFKNMMKTATYSLPYLYAPDGNIYSLGSVGETYHATMAHKGWIDQTLLDKAGVKVPTTTDEFETALKAIKALGSNIVPFTGADGDKNSCNGIDDFIMQSFVYYDRTSYMMVDNGKVEFSANTDAYKQGLKYIRKLVSEGLIPPESFTQDRQALKNLSENPAGDLLGGCPAMTYTHFTAANATGIGCSTRYKDFVTMPVLKGPGGKTYGLDTGYSVSVGQFAITKSCKNPAAAIRWQDEIYDENKCVKSYDEVAELGKKGSQWTDADPGSKGIDGSTAGVWQVTATGSGSKQNDHWNSTALTYQTNAFRMGQEDNGTATQEHILYQATKTNYKPYSAAKYQLPYLYYPADDYSQLGDVQTNVRNVVQTYQVQFATGRLDIDKDWNTYINELNNAGLKSYLQITQKAYDNQQKVLKENK